MIVSPPDQMHSDSSQSIISPNVENLPSAARHGFEAEIFSIGTWNGDVFALADLVEIANNFKYLYPAISPPLKCGHDEAQTLLGQSDGDPALGWVNALWVQGDKLMAHFESVPHIVWKAIQEGRYRHISAEIYWNLTHQGKLLGKALKAVALLGADLPAVTNLQDLNAFLSEPSPKSLPSDSNQNQVNGIRYHSLSNADECRRFEYVLNPHTTYSTAKNTVTNTANHPFSSTPENPLTSSLFSINSPPSVPPIERLDMNNPIATRAKTAAELDSDQLMTELAELRAYRMAQEQKTKEAKHLQQKQAFQSAYDQVMTFCEARVKEGVLSPVERDQLLHEVNRQARHFSIGQPLHISLEWVFAFVRKRSTLLSQEETAIMLGTQPHQMSSTSPGGITSEYNPSQILANRIKNLMSQETLSYSKAAERIFAEDPQLAENYRLYTVHPTH